MMQGSKPLKKRPIAQLSPQIDADCVRSIPVPTDVLKQIANESRLQWQSLAAVVGPTVAETNAKSVLAMITNELSPFVTTTDNEKVQAVSSKTDHSQTFKNAKPQAKRRKISANETVLPEGTDREAVRSLHAEPRRLSNKAKVLRESTNTRAKAFYKAASKLKCRNQASWFQARMSCREGSSVKTTPAIDSSKQNCSEGCATYQPLKLTSKKAPPVLPGFDGESLTPTTSHPHEDSLICPGWDQIAQQLSGKHTDRQIQERSCNNKPWASDEDKAVLRSYRVFGDNWGALEQRIPWRSKNALKDRCKELRSQGQGQPVNGGSHQ